MKRRAEAKIAEIETKICASEDEKALDRLTSACRGHQPAGVSLVARARPRRGVVVKAVENAGMVSCRPSFTFVFHEQELVR